jgi:murein DD-endopeptidase MepM/ murein hydrolase activator NlpD
MVRIVAASFALVVALSPARAASAGALDLIAPVDGPIVRHFEPPPTPYAAGHRGLDFAADAGTSVVASAGGVVAFAGQVGGRLFVSIDHDEGFRTTYSYLEAIVVKEGQAVAQGEPVGRSGLGHLDPDAPQDPHLHFGLRQGSGYLDPEPLLLDGMRRDLSRVVSLAA